MVKLVFELCVISYWVVDSDRIYMLFSCLFDIVYY